MMNRIIYLGYYIQQTPKKQFYKYFDYVKKQRKISSFSLYKDIVASSLKYNTSLMDYFKLRFFEKTSKEREEYAGVGFMYEYQLKMNPKGYREVLGNKAKFLEHFKDFVGRKWATIEMLEQNPALMKTFLENENGRVVVKNRNGQAGKEVDVLETKDLTGDALLDIMRKNKYDLVETFVVQHDEFMRIAPNALNTVRIVTQLVNENDVRIIDTSIRLSIHTRIDNMRAGNIAMPLDPETGKICGNGAYTDITKEDTLTHPLTGVQLMGFQVPYWKEIKDFAIKAAKHTPENKSIGWDIGLTNDGPILIEGNHNWSHELSQVPIKKGLKKVLLQFLEK